MLKLAILSIVLICLLSPVFASDEIPEINNEVSSRGPFDPGNIAFSGSVQAGYGGSRLFPDPFQMSIEPGLSVFYAQGCSFGVNANYIYSNNNGASQLQFGIGPALMFFLNPESDVCPYILGSVKITSKERYHGYQLTGSMGTSIFVGEKTALSIYLESSYFSLSRGWGSRNGYTISMGLGLILF